MITPGRAERWYDGVGRPRDGQTICVVDQDAHATYLPLTGHRFHTARPSLL